MKKKTVSVRLDALEYDYWEGPIDNLIGRLSELKLRYNKYDDLIFHTEQYWDNPPDFILTGTRLETDEELETRKKKSVAARKAAVTKKQKQEEEEKEQLTKLLKKYPNFT